jgi:hypothetical protein
MKSRGPTSGLRDASEVTKKGYFGNTPVTIGIEIMA